MGVVIIITSGDGDGVSTSFHTEGSANSKFATELH